MKVIYNVSAVKRYRNPVVAMGVFDGMHIAHRHILRELIRLSRRIKGTSIVLTFSPHPQKEESLYSLEHRLRLIGELGIDVAIVVKFDRRFARLGAHDFVKNILVKKIGARYIYVGENFRFGQSARGDAALLLRLAKTYGFKVRLFDVLKIKRCTVSSTQIRRLITAGKLLAAKQLLGRPVSVYGTVVRGQALGSKLGFPTANIDPHHEILPPAGIYAVTVALNNKKLQGVCYIGSRPTLGISQEKNIEAHIFDFKKSLYGKNLELRFIRKLRNDRKFPSLSLLTAQIKKDISRARNLLRG